MEARIRDVALGYSRGGTARRAGPGNRWKTRRVSWRSYWKGGLPKNLANLLVPEKGVSSEIAQTTACPDQHGPSPDGNSGDLPGAMGSLRWMGIDGCGRFKSAAGLIKRLYA
jgi:hypothetical protein